MTAGGALFTAEAVKLAKANASRAVADQADLGTALEKYISHNMPQAKHLGRAQGD
jgi:hypothetical protein